MTNSIRRLRERTGMQQVQLARKIFRSVSAVWAYENGKTSPCWQDVAAMCEVFGCTAEELMSAPRDSVNFPRVHRDIDEQAIGRKLSRLRDRAKSGDLSSTEYYIQVTFVLQGELRSAGYMTAADELDKTI